MSPRNARPAAATPAAAFEDLEGRRMLSVSVVKNVIQVSGSPRNDRVIIQRDSQFSERISINVNGVVFTRSLERFKRIEVSTGKGNDRIVLSDDYGLLPTSRIILVNGDSGDDTLIGANGNDDLHGGGGNDVINGGHGNDTLIGGADDDTISGGPGVDSMLGEDGDDVIFGNQGNDVFEGGLGDDVFYGGTGNDSMHGGEGDDTMYGNEDSDTIFGDEGVDELHDGAGRDILTP